MLRAIYFFAKRIYTRAINPYSIIESNVRLHGDNTMGRYIRICENSRFINSQIGNFSYIGPNSKIYNTFIGKFTSIGPNMTIIEGRHPAKIFVSTHPSFFSLRKQCGKTFVKEQKFEEFKKVDGFSVSVGNDVWIGESVKIADGVKIGDGAVIGASSLVVKDIVPYSVNAGIPSKIISYRFEKKYIDWLLKFKWWDKDMQWLQAEAENFDNIEKLYDKYGYEKYAEL